MALFDFIKSHIDDINSFTQPAIQWRAGRFVTPVLKAEGVGGDFANVMATLPNALTRNDVVACYQEDLYKGFVATILWGGISRYQAEEVSRRNDRQSSIPKLERIRQMLRDSKEDVSIIDDAVASMKRGKENSFYGIGPSFFTKLLYFLSFDLDLETRPLIYDENLKPVHFALMPECGQNPFSFYVPVGGKIHFAEDTSFEDVYVPYCMALCEVANELGVDVTNLESWLFGWPVNIKKEQPNPREIARVEVERMAATGFVRSQCRIEDLYDAIGASRIFYDNKIDVSELLCSENDELHIGNDKEHPIVITETDNYVHLEYVITDILFHMKNLESKMISQHCLSVGDRKLDRLCFEVKSAQDQKPIDMDVFFDITAGYETL